MGAQGGGGTLKSLIFSAYVGSGPATTVHPQKISEISSTLKKYLKSKQPKKISPILLGVWYSLFIKNLAYYSSH